MPAAAPSDGRRGWEWLLDAALGIAPWLACCVVMSGTCFWIAASDWRDRATAIEVAAQGDWATVTDVEVYVDYESSKGGGWYEVGGVRVQLPDRPGRIELAAVSNADTPLSEDVDWREGWQQATAQTGYQPPLRVRVGDRRDDGTRDVMAASDLAYWTQDNDDPEIGLSLGAGLLGVGALSLLISGVVQQRRSRIPPLSAYPGPTRAARRAAQAADQPWSFMDRRRRRHRR